MSGRYVYIGRPFKNDGDKRKHVWLSDKTGDYQHQPLRPGQTGRGIGKAMARAQGGEPDSYSISEDE